MAADLRADHDAPGLSGGRHHGPSRRSLGARRRTARVIQQLRIPRHPRGARPLAQKRCAADIGRRSSPAGSTSRPARAPTLPLERAAAAPSRQTTASRNRDQPLRCLTCLRGRPSGRTPRRPRHRPRRGVGKPAWALGNSGLPPPLTRSSGSARTSAVGAPSIPTGGPRRRASPRASACRSAGERLPRDSAAGPRPTTWFRERATRANERAIGAISMRPAARTRIGLRDYPEPLAPSRRIESRRRRTDARIGHVPAIAAPPILRRLAARSRRRRPCRARTRTFAVIR